MYQICRINKYFKWNSVYVFIFAVGIFAASCSSSVRFAENASRSKGNDYSERSSNSGSSASVKSQKVLGSKPNTNFEKKLVSESEEWLGTPYAWGGNTKRGVDCSGFVKQVYEEMGYMLPRTAAQQYEYTDRIKDEERKIGDLVFFKEHGKISHVGIYIGNDTVIHSASKRGVVKQNITNTYLEKLYAGAGRVK